MAEQIFEIKNALNNTKNTESKTKRKEKDLGIKSLHPQQDLTCTDVQLTCNENVKERKRDSDIMPCTLHSQQNLIDITEFTHTTYKNIQSNKDITNVSHDEISQTLQINMSNIDKKETHDYDTVSMSNKAENEYSDLNDEHNWRNKNERRTRIKRTYLQPRQILRV